jgi:hypothetical protein
MLPEKPAHLSTRTFPPADSCVVYRCNASEVPASHPNPSLDQKLKTPPMRATRGDSRLDTTPNVVAPVW